ncbi:MAG: HIT family protein [Fimbriimonas sp.]
MLTPCPFCNYQDEAAVVYRDDLCFAVISQRPINPFHTLVIPHPHYERFTDLPDEVTTHLFLVARKTSTTPVSTPTRSGCGPGWRRRKDD